MMRALLARELRLAWRSGAEILNPLWFFLIVITLFPFGVGAAPQLLAQIAPGVVWVAALLAALLVMDRLFRDDWQDGSLEQLMLLPTPLVAVVLVVISQIKINVTNAYSGSLAWTSAWTRTTKRYPGRIIFVVVNLAIALALMEGDMFSALSWILGFYSNFAIAWVVVVATDITFNKGLLKLAPAQPEYRRGMIYNVNPVGVVSFGLAAGLSICAFFGLLGATLAPFSPLIALVVAFVMTPLMGLLTRGRYYIKQVDDGIAEPRYDAAGNASTTVYQCVSCEEEYERPDVMHSHKHQGAICSLCKSME